jgi:single-strand DNA-binding protein
MLRNQVTLVGYLGKDANVTRFENGSMVARFSMAVNQSEQNIPNWYSLFAWGNIADFVNKNCKKGNKVAITGKLVNRTIVTEAGTPRKITEVEVRQVMKL